MALPLGDPLYPPGGEMSIPPLGFERRSGAGIEESTLKKEKCPHALALPAGDRSHRGSGSNCDRPSAGGSLRCSQRPGYLVREAVFPPSSGHRWSPGHPGTGPESGAETAGRRPPAPPAGAGGPGAGAGRNLHPDAALAVRTGGFGRAGASHALPGLSGRASGDQRRPPDHRLAPGRGPVVGSQRTERLVFHPAVRERPKAAAGAG